jgi:hypothetical protein
MRRGPETREPWGPMKPLALELLPETYAICRLGPEDGVPAWATGGAFSSLTRTRTELTIVCAQGAVPEGVQCERGWRCLGVEGLLADGRSGKPGEPSGGSWD